MPFLAYRATAYALLAIATLLIHAAHAAQGSADGNAQSPKCSLKQLAALEVGVLGNDVVLPVELDGHRGIMALRPDTANSFVWDHVVREGWLPRHQIIGRMGFQPPPAEVMPHSPEAKNMKWIQEQATFKSLILGALDFGEGHLLIAPPAPEDLRDLQAPTLGLLGMDALLQIDFELDLAHGRMNVFSQNHCPGQVVYWSRDYASVPLFRDQIGRMFFVVQLDGKQVQASIAPAMATSTITTELAKRLYGFDPQPADADSVHKMQIAAPGLTIDNAKLGTRDVNRECVLRIHDTARTGVAYESRPLCLSEYPLYIGRDILEDLRLFFAMKEKKLYFTAANAAN